MRNALRIRGELGELHVNLRGPRAEADILFQPFQPATMPDISLGAEQKFACVGSVAEALAQTSSDPVVRSIDLIGKHDAPIVCHSAASAILSRLARTWLVLLFAMLELSFRRSCCHAPF